MAITRSLSSAITDGTGAITPANVSVSTNNLTVGTSMYVVANGNVGFACTTPGAWLDIYALNTGIGQSGNNGLVFRAQDGIGRPPIAAYGGVDGTGFPDSVATAVAIRQISGTGRSLTTTGSVMVGGSLTTATNTATIGTGTYFVSNGNVGIANNSPTSTLTVGGNTYFGNSITFSDSTQMTTAASTGMKNKLINGGFDIWQRATSFSNWSSFSYLVDRWRIGFDGTAPTGISLTQGTFTPGQTAVAGDPKYYLIYTFPNTGTPSNYIRSDTESVRTFAGRTCTFSFWAAVPSGTMTVGVMIAQEFGTGGSPSAGVYPTQTNYTVTTTWQRFVFTVTMPSISGKTLGTNGDDRIWPAIYFPTNAAGTIWLANMQLEDGSVATPFERRPLATELALCQRYYYRMLPPASVDGTIYGSGCNESSTIADCAMGCFPTTMRAIPTVTLGSSVIWYSPTGGVVTPTIRTNRCSTTNPSLYLNITGATAGQAGVLFSNGTTPSTCYVDFSSEM